MPPPRFYFSRKEKQIMQPASSATRGSYIANSSSLAAMDNSVEPVSLADSIPTTDEDKVAENILLHIKNKDGAALSSLMELHNISSLYLSWQDLLPDAATTAVAGVLETNTTLTTLNYFGNKLTPEGVNALAHALEANTTLTKLELYANGMGPEGGGSIGDALKVNTTLTSLSLRENKLGLNAVKAIAEGLQANTTLTGLDLGWNRLGGNSVQALGKGLKENTGLTTLNLKATSLGPADGKVMGDMLKNNTTMTALDLSCNRLDKESATALADALKSNNALKTLDLSGNPLGPDGGISIASALKENTSLTTLDLRGTQLGPTGDKRRRAMVAGAIAKGLETNTVLTTLRLEQNNLDGGNYHERLIESLMQRNRMLDPLSRQDATTCSRILPGHQLPLDVGQLIAKKLIMMAGASCEGSTACYERTMVDVQCSLNALAAAQPSLQLAPVPVQANANPGTVQNTVNLQTGGAVQLAHPLFEGCTLV
jgi:Ran GTPase-activating protein (RanGAP) involved in mRNA processing and transport